MDLADVVAVFVVSLLVGTVAILVGVRLLLDSDAAVPNALFAALVGAVVWSAAGYAEVYANALDWLPLLGAVLLLVVWIVVVNWRYPGGWGAAATIGVTAWLVAVAIVYGLSFVGVVAPEVLGLPGG